MPTIRLLELVPPPINAPPLKGERLMFSITLSADGSLAGIWGQYVDGQSHYFGYWVNRNGTTIFFQPQYSIPASQVLWPTRLMNNSGKLVGGARLVDGTYRIFVIDTFTGIFNDIEVPAGIRQVQLYGILDSDFIISHFDVYPGPTLLTAYIINDGPPRKFNLPGYVQTVLIRSSPSGNFLTFSARKATDSTTTFRTLIKTNGLEGGVISDLGDKIIIEIDDKGSYVRMESSSALPSWEAPGTLVSNGASIDIPTKLTGNKIVDARQSILKQDGLLLGVYRATDGTGTYSGLFTFKDGIVTDLMSAATPDTLKFKYISPTKFNEIGQISLTTQDVVGTKNSWNSYRCLIT